MEINSARSRKHCSVDRNTSAQRVRRFALIKVLLHAPRRALRKRIYAGEAPEPLQVRPVTPALAISLRPLRRSLPLRAAAPLRSRPDRAAGSRGSRGRRARHRPRRVAAWQSPAGSDRALTGLFARASTALGSDSTPPSTPTFSTSAAPGERRRVTVRRRRGRAFNHPPAPRRLTALSLRGTRPDSGAR